MVVAKRTAAEIKSRCGFTCSAFISCSPNLWLLRSICNLIPATVGMCLLQQLSLVQLLPCKRCTSSGSNARPRSLPIRQDSGWRTLFSDLKVGTGAEAVEPSKCSMNWVLRRSVGYFVDASNTDGFSTKKDNFDESNSFVFTVGDGKALKGVDAGVRGMKQGGVRRLVLPVSVAYTLPIDKSAGPPSPAIMGRDGRSRGAPAPGSVQLF